MASFVMHYIAGEVFLNNLDSDLSNYDKNNFRLGNLVVDTMGMSSYSRDEKLVKKMVTHFRNSEDNDKCIQIPNVNKFKNKYESLIEKDYSAMGYLFHLFTDKLFFEYLYRDVIEILDRNMLPTIYKKDNRYIKVLKNNKIFKVEDFYSGSNVGGLYRDYSNMNKYLINKYKIEFNYDELNKFSLENFSNPGIDEIDYNNIGEVLDKMNVIIKESLASSDVELKVFNTNDIENIIYNIVKDFNTNYKKSINKLVKTK